jgi:hypothetical protein
MRAPDVTAMREIDVAPVDCRAISMRGCFVVVEGVRITRSPSRAAVKCR